MPPPTQRPWRIAHSESSLGWGGQEHRVLAELTGFQNRGCPVWLLAPRQSQILHRAVQAGIPVLAVSFQRLMFLWNLLRLSRWLRRERIEVLNSHSSRDGWVLGLAGRLAHTAFVIRSRHIDVDYPNNWVSRHAYTTLADHVLTTSQKISAHIQTRFGLPARRITTLPTGIDLLRFTPEGAKADFGAISPARPCIGMVSVLRSWKGHQTFLQAARRLTDAGFCAAFIIVGEGPMRPVIEEEIDRLRLRAVVTLTGHREDVPAVLRALDVLVIASTRHEGVPQIGLQALATRTPVVGSDVGGTPEIIRHGETGRNFPAEDVGALTRALRETLAEAEATRRMCRQGRVVVEQHHNLDAMLDQLDGIYRHYVPDGRRT